MGLGGILVLIILIVLAILALKFLVGITRKVISFALFIVAGSIVVYMITGFDAFGIGSAVGAAIQGLLP